MPGRYLLDSNTVIGLLNGQLDDRRQAIAGGLAYVSIVILGELYFGARHSTRVQDDLTRIQRFADQTTILGCDHGTARLYGRIKDRLRRKGRPIPENDLWIAASARQHGLVVVTRDRHFHSIDGLPVEAW